MSGQPPIGTWATTTDYPPGSSPWSGNPTKIQPTQTYWIPATGVSAPEHNYIINQLYAELAAVEAAGGSALVAQNWQSVIAAGPANANALAWNPILSSGGAFITVEKNSGPLYQFVYNSGADLVWTTLGSTFNVNSSSPNVTALACGPAQGVTWASFINSSNVGYLWSCTVGGSTDALLGTGNVSNMYLAAAATSGVDWGVLAIASGTSGDSALYFLTATGATGLSTGLTEAQWAVASNGSLVVAVGTDRIVYSISSSSGTSGTVSTANIASVLGTDLPISMAYGTSTTFPSGAFILCCSTTTSGQRRYYASQTGTGATWVSLGVATTSAAAEVSQIVACGSLWLGLVSLAGGVAGVIMAPNGIDFGGSATGNWQSTQTRVVPSGSAEPMIAAGPTQAAIAMADGGPTFRFSQISGPGTALT